MTTLRLAIEDAKLTDHKLRVKLRGELSSKDAWVRVRFSPTGAPNLGHEPAAPEGGPDGNTPPQEEREQAQKMFESIREALESRRLCALRVEVGKKQVRGVEIHATRES